MPSLSASCLRDSPRSARSTASRLWTRRWLSGIGGLVGLDPGEHQRGQRRDIQDHPHRGGQEGVGIEPQGFATFEVDLGSDIVVNQYHQKNAVRQGIGRLAKDEKA